MPSRREHVRACKVLLGFSDPIVHQVMDAAVSRLGPRHRYLTHNLEFVRSIAMLFGDQAKLEAVFHMLHDWGLIRKEDYAYKDFRTRDGRRRR